MNPLSFNRTWLVWISVYPVDNDEIWKKRIARFIVILIVILTIVSSLVASVTFFLKFVSRDLEAGLYAVALITAFSGCFYTLLIAQFQRQKIKLIFSNLTQIYDSIKSSELFEVLLQANNKCNWVCQFYLRYMIGGCIVSIIGSSITSLLFSYFWFGRFNRKVLYIPYPFLFPWDQNTLTGYLGEIIFGAIAAASYLTSVGSMLLLFISICIHHRAFHEIFKRLTRKLNHQNNNIEGSMHELIRFYMSVKDWFSQTAAVYSLIIVIVLLYSMMIMALELFQVDLALRNITLNLSIYLVSGGMGASNLWLYCYFGRLTTGSYGKMSDSLYDSNWPEIPVRLQKYYLVMVANMQRPVQYRGFGVVILNLETFCSLIRAVCSYFVIFKKITAE